MVARPTWKGQLKLSLVSCAVRLYPSTTRGGRIAFNLLHKDTHNRVNMVPHDPDLGAVERADLVKGYQYEKGRYVILEDEDFDKVRLESSHAMVIERFVDLAAIDPIYLEAPYYVVPDGKVAEETFGVIHEAMKQKKKAAISRIVLSSREHPIVIAVRDKGFLMTTLRTADEVRGEKPYFADIPAAEPEREMLDLAVQLIAQKSGKWDPRDFVDRYEAALDQVIQAKIRGEAPVVAAEPERPGNVINLMDALKRSLRGSEGKPPATSKRRASAGKRKTKAPAKRKPARKRA